MAETKQIFLNFLLLLFGTILVAAKDYSGYKVYDISPTKTQIPLLMEWEFHAGIDFWSYAYADNPARVMVAPEIEENFLKFLDQNDVTYKVAIENVETMLRQDKIKRLTSELRKAAWPESRFSRYWSLAEMEDFFRELNASSLVNVDAIGKSYENNTIYGVRVSKNSQFGLNPIIFVDAGTHAREWAGIQSAFYFLYQLVENATANDHLLDKVDYVFVPMVNPDGYKYSFTVDRMWRKNRRYINSTCTGIDLNRNYPYMWRYSADSCSGNGHPGPYALSEPETQAVSKYMESFKYNLRLYLSTHTHGSMVLSPFGFAMGVYINNHKEHQILGQKFANAIKAATGTEYIVGNSADILYIASGASDDFAVAYANANFAYTLELPKGGDNNFDYPEDEIHDLVKETFIGYQAMALYIKERFNFD